MNLVLHPHTNVNDPVWSVIFMVFLSLCMAGYSIYYILGIAFAELENGRTDTTKRKISETRKRNAINKKNEKK